MHVEPVTRKCIYFVYNQQWGERGQGMPLSTFTPLLIPFIIDDPVP